MGKVVGFIGRMSSGKTTAADIMTKQLSELGATVKVFKIADPIYAVQDMHQLLYCVTMLTCAKCSKLNLESAENCYYCGSEDLSVCKKDRLFLMSFGDYIRNTRGDLYFTFLAEGRLKHIPDNEIWICDDIRLRSEYDMFKRVNGFLYEINADLEKRKERGISLGTWTDKPHRTELEMEGYGNHPFIDNNGYMVEFEDKLFLLSKELMGVK